MTGLVEKQREHFNGIAATYYAARRGANHLALKDLIWAEFLRDKAVLRRPGLTVLDAMCGHADAHDLLSRHLGIDVAYSGFDYSDEVVARVQRENPDLEITQADATTFRPTRQYDLVTLIGGLHHVHDAATEALTRLATAVRPGGHFLSFEPTHGNSVFGAVRNAVYRRNALFDADTEQGFSTRSLFAMFERAGLERVDVLYPGLLSYVLYYNPDAFPKLNVGGPGAVRRLFALERPFMRGALARTLSFATLSLWRKPEPERPAE
ncbi:MAG: class I SAM-dependent methyltransferase [Bauldia sp.]